MSGILPAQKAKHQSSIYRLAFAEKQIRLFQLLRPIMDCPGILEERKTQMTRFLNNIEIAPLDVVIICNIIATHHDSRYVELSGQPILDILGGIAEGKLKSAKELASDARYPIDPKVALWLKRAGQPALTLVFPHQEQSSPAASKSTCRPKFEPQPKVRHRLLTREEEFELFKQIKSGVNVEKTKSILATCNQGLVRKIASRFTGRGLEYLDLVQEGNLGLLRTIEKFDCGRGAKFSTYARWWIEAFIQRAITNKGRTIRLPAQTKQETWGLIKLCDNFRADNGRYPTEEELVEITEYPLKKVQRLLAATLVRNIPSLDRPVYSDESDGPTLLLRIPGEIPDPEDLTVVRVDLAQFIGALSPPQRRIIKLLYGMAPDYPGQELTLEETGEIVGFTGERVRQLKEKIIAQLVNMVRRSKPLLPPIKWLNDQEALDLMLENLTPRERTLFELTFDKWVCLKKAARILRKSRAQVKRVRQRLKDKLDLMYNVIQAAKHSAQKDLGRPLRIGDILEEANITHDEYKKISRSLPQIRIMIASILTLSLKLRLAKAVAIVRQRLADNELTPAHRTARLAGINACTLTEIINLRPHLLPEGVQFKTALRDEKLENYAIHRIRQLVAKIEGGQVPYPATFKEIAEQLGIWNTSLAEWRERFPEVKATVDQIIARATRRRTRNGVAISAAVIERQNKRLLKVEEAALAYKRTYPDQSLVPVIAVIKSTGIPENTLLKLIKENEDHIRSQGIEFRTSRRGDEKEEYALARIDKIKKEIAKGTTATPRNKTELCRILGISRNTIINWEKSSEKIKKAVADLFAVNSDTIGRLHRRDQMPDTERPSAFSQAYKRVSKGRDLGREPVKVPELADSIGYSEANIYYWINNIPQIIRPGMVLDLRHGRRNKIHRRRRIQWALNFARKNGFTYMSLNEFLEQRLGICRGSFNLWKKADPQLPKIFEKQGYEGIIN